MSIDATESYEFEILGRVLYELQRGTESIAELCTWLDFWRQKRLGHSRFIIEWSGGPYAEEVHESLLRAIAADPESSHPFPYPITTARGCAPDHMACNVAIGGVPFLLRSLTPVGWETATTRNITELFSACVELGRSTPAPPEATS
ncbi:hypothetical protein DMP17_44565 [Pseudonocardia sp. TMWB2A]